MNPDDFTDSHHNTVVVATLFRVMSDNLPKNSLQNQIILISYYYDIFDQDRKSYWDRELPKIYHFCPLSSYNSHLTPFQLQHQNFSKTFTKLPLSEQIFMKFSLEKSVGCDHYIRGCEYQCPDCKDFFGCRMCHQDVSDHNFRRFDVETIKCRKCATIQPFSQICTNCSLTFGWYCCGKCKLICDLGYPGKPIFHSELQNACSIGIERESIYCKFCDWCYQKHQFESHFCKKITGNCSCCLEDLDGTNKPRLQLKCSHNIHWHCFELLIEQNDIKCPICRKSMLQDEQLEEYREWFVKQQNKYFFNCNSACYWCLDCGAKFDETEHFFGVVCQECKGCNCQVQSSQIEEGEGILSFELISSKFAVEEGQEGEVRQFFDLQQIKLNNQIVRLLNECVSKQLSLVEVIGFIM